MDGHSTVIAGDKDIDVTGRDVPVISAARSDQSERKGRHRGGGIIDRRVDGNAVVKHGIGLYHSQPSVVPYRKRGDIHVAISVEPRIRSDATLNARGGGGDGVDSHRTAAHMAAAAEDDPPLRVEHAI